MTSRTSTTDRPIVTPGPVPVCRRVRNLRRGLGLIELLTIVAVLIVALALIVATARHVRSSSANELTRKRLQALVDQASRLIVAGGENPTLVVPALLLADAVGNDSAQLMRLESVMQAYARESAERLAALLAASSVLSDAVPRPAPLANVTPLGATELRDAWGRPIALVPHQLPAIGIAPDDGPFFVSAGPDGAFLTLADNLYSYELPALLPPIRQGGASRRVPSDPSD